MKNSLLTAPFIGVSRHRLGVDGQGVATLVCFHGCPLHCRYCPNDVCHDSGKNRWMSVRQLYDYTKVDELYFLATGGGVTFGGGEPLLRGEFIKAFRDLCGPKWHVTLETSLNVSKDKVTCLLSIVDELIVDIKDMNPKIYESYTGVSNKRVIQNLGLLAEHKRQNDVVIRIPFIENYNTEEDRKQSVSQLREMGFTRFNLFNYKT